MEGSSPMSSVKKAIANCTPKITGNAASMTVPVEAKIPVEFDSYHVDKPKIPPNSRQIMLKKRLIDAAEKSLR